MPVTKPSSGTNVNTHLSISSGIIGAWILNEGSGTTAHDTSGSGNNASLTGGPSWSSGPYGSAVTLNGSSQYVATGTGFGTTAGTMSAITVAVNFKSANTGGNVGVWYLGDLASDSGVVDLDLVVNNLNMRKNPTTELQTAFTDTASWHYYVTTYDGSHFNMWMDGSHIGNNIAATGTLNMSGCKAVLGAYYAGNFSLNGQVSDMIIWNRALNSTEVTVTLAADPFAPFRGACPSHLFSFVG